MDMNDRIEEQQRTELFESPADLEAFFGECDALEGPALEPDWDEHLDTIAASRGCRCNTDSGTAAQHVPN